MNTLNVKARKFQLVLMAMLGAFFLPMSAWLLFSGVRAGIKVVPIAIGGLLLVTFVIVVMLFLRGRGMSVDSFTETGLARIDGREFLWTDLHRVVNKMASRSATRKGLWRTEIQFTDGSSAWIIPSKVANYDEVRDFVGRLGCEHIQEDA